MFTCVPTVGVPAPIEPMWNSCMHLIGSWPFVPCTAYRASFKVHIQCDQVHDEQQLEKCQWATVDVLMPSASKTCYAESSRLLTIGFTARDKGGQRHHQQLALLGCMGGCSC